MGRHKKNIAEPCCYHITHRCQERRFLLRFQLDRDNYQKRLYDASRRFKVSILNYIITSNHIHIILYSAHAKHISDFMHYLQGNTARDYNRRKKREGAFWRGRYHSTMIQSGEHLSRCLFYIDMNMMRAGECKHPAEWSNSGYHELCGTRERYRIIDKDRLLKCVAHSGTFKVFKAWYEATLRETLLSYGNQREALWTESLAVGEYDWIEKLKDLSGIPSLKITPITGNLSLNKNKATYALTGSTRYKDSFWKKQQEKS
jgi:REP-associated tyrosine transposase